MSVFYVTLEAVGRKVRIARSATKADAQHYIEELGAETNGFARVAKAHGVPVEFVDGVSVDLAIALDIEEVPGDYDKGDGIEHDPDPRRWEKPAVVVEPAPATEHESVDVHVEP